MSSRSYLGLLIIILALHATGRGQESHVQLRHDKDAAMTVATSDALYVINMATQFMQLQLVGRYPTQSKTAKGPALLSLQFFSYAREPLYQTDDSHRLKVKADAQVLDFGLLIYSKIDEKYEGRDGQTWTNSSARAALPTTALVRTASKSNGLTLEIMSVRNLALADLKALATAESVVMQIGPTVFPLKPIHMTILRQFVDAISQANVNPVADSAAKQPVDTSDVPSDANNAPLEETLKWLKNLMDKQGETTAGVVPTKLETLKFKDCSVRYRLVPRFRNTHVSNDLFYSIMEYEMNLADLNPEIVMVTNHGSHATVVLTTRDVREKIRITARANDRPNTVRTVGERHSANTSVSLKSFEAAARFKVALIHAINLCTR